MKTERIFFSIIIPTYNRAELICGTIQSILNQKKSAFEIIIVDDGSTDNTFDVVGSLNDDRIAYKKINNCERGAARNHGLTIAKGEYIIFFDSDDLLNDCLFEISQFILSKASPDVVYGIIENISSENNTTEIVSPAFKSFKHSILHNNFLACGSVFIKRTVAINYPFSEDRHLSGTEDWELWLRIFADIDFVYCPVVVLKQRLHADRSLQKMSLARIVEREYAFASHIEKNETRLHRRFSRGELRLLKADRFTLIALAQAELHFRNAAFNFLIKSTKTSIQVLKRKRYWAVLKKLLLTND